jgi:hypothetical protein
MELIILIVVVAFVGLVTLPRYLRTRRALAEPIGGDQCVACNATSVTMFAPECYRCDACRFTWGDGMAALAQQQRAQQIAQLGATDRHALAKKELEEAASRLLGADASLEHASNQLGLDLIAGGGIGAGDMYSRARSEGIVKAAGEMGMAQKHIRNAAEAMGWRIEGHGASIDFHSELFALDAHFESMLLDIAAHMQVGKLKKQAAAMRQGVDAALVALRQQPPA